MKYTDEVNIAINGAYGYLARTLMKHWRNDINEVATFLEGFSVAMELVRVYPQFAADMTRMLEDERPQLVKDEGFVYRMAETIVNDYQL